MRDAITEVREHGAKKFKTLFNSDTPLSDQQSSIKKMRGSTSHEKYAEVRYFESSRKFTFQSPAEVKARKEAADKAAAKLAKEAEKSAPVETKTEPEKTEPNPLTETKQ